MFFSTKIIIQLPRYRLIGSLKDHTCANCMALSKPFMKKSNNFPKETGLLTLMIIFLLRLFGDGRKVALDKTGSVRSISPKMSLKASAMFRCCGIVQWFSIDRINGYLQNDTNKWHQQMTPTNDTNITISTYQYQQIIPTNDTNITISTYDTSKLYQQMIHGPATSHITLTY